ncbi:AI-2E family transporter [Methylothermus subterraneus]
MNSQSAGHRWLFTLAALMVVIAGLRAAAEILVPFLLSVFIAILLWPLVEWLYRHRVPAWLAILIAVLGLMVLMIVLGVFVGKSIDSFIGNLPYYQSRLQANTAGLIAWLNAHGFEISRERFGEFFNAGRLMQLAGTLLTTLTGAFANTALILFYVTFMFLEAFLLPYKLQRIFGDSTLAARFETFFANLRRYLHLKNLISLATGLAVAFWLSLLEVDYPILWGTVAYVLNFIPNIGSFVAALPAILLALVQHGVGGAAYTALGYLVINTVIGGFIDPRVVGKGLGISTLAVLLSLIFWGWVLGPVGMFLSVPITVILKMFMEDNPATCWIAILLGSGTEDERKKT